MKSLKKIITVCIILFSIVIGKAQVGIGTTAPDGALDITSSTDGLLIPRVALTITTSALPLTSPTISELVYNSATVADVTPGYYYWNGTIWVRLAAGVTNDWSILGNAGTTPATNFIGTTDNQDFAIRRNNLRAGYIGDATFTPVTFIFNNGNTSFGANSLVNPTVNIGLQLGVRNTAFGANTMPSLTSGNRNVGVGESVLFSNSTGSENTAIGVGALYSNTTGSSNVAIGRNALTTSSIASNNTAVGFTALRNTTGTDNTAIGINAGSTITTGSNNIMIGANTVAPVVTGSSQLNIGNTVFGNMTGALTAGVNTTRTIGVNVLTPLAALDVTSSNNGILIPRISLTLGTNSALPLVAPTTSEIIYNTNTTLGVNQVTPGFYYWNGSSWVRFSTGVQTGWLTTGNTVGAAGSFIGTLDNFDVAFKRNNLASGFIGANSTAFGVGTLAANTGINNTAFGTNALSANTTSANNTAFGFNALAINTPGSDTGALNTAVGSGALASLNGGNNNTAIGYNALTLVPSTTRFNTAVGSNALSGVNSAASINNVAVGYNTITGTGTVTESVAIGSGALRLARDTSTRNTAVGYNAGSSLTTGTDNVLIGNLAGSSEAGASSNKLFIENTNANASNALIYGEFDTNILRVNGTLQVNNPAGVNGYALPNTRGTSGQILITDGAGVTSWAPNPLTTLSLVRVNLGGSNQVLTAPAPPGTWEKINFSTEVFDTSSEFTGGTFTATKAGFYQINAGFHTNDQTNLQQYAIGVFVNGVLYQETSGNHTNLGEVSRNINCIVNLAIGNTVEIFVKNFIAGVEINGFIGKTFFEVSQIR
ncbi:hypothetical protein [Flavobacterium sp.]|uniref:beta strand repeat-containing protein n=1 Tax=Flavobacterium sp. TaxID=239 RepID=UPI0025C6E7B9|nr:hypothetical protein [Flavobacterium sp.]MBA4155478.1 hypothetical protein [Flavobacterium sp.]